MFTDTHKVTIVIGYQNDVSSKHGKMIHRENEDNLVDFTVAPRAPLSA